ncbi:hypothetical protein BH10ACI1_BH10ACI1_23040 [soil metagenome]
MKNIIETKLTQNDRDRIDELITELEAQLADKLAALTAEERVKYGSINEQNKLLVNKVRDYRQNSPAMSAPEVDWAEFDNDFQSRAFLETRAQRLASLVYQMQSTKILHDYDNYQDARKDYGYAQYKKGAGEPGFAEKVAELRQFFPRSNKNDPPDAGGNG